jgi:hypothetical protein
VDQRGVLADFLVCKIGVAIAALALLGAALAMSSSFEHTAEREDLAMLADVIVSAIQTVERLPGEVELRKELPTRAQGEVTIIGERSGEAQVIRIIVGAQKQVERTLILTSTVNGGDFTLSRESPSTIHLSKRSEIQLELI